MPAVSHRVTRSALAALLAAHVGVATLFATHATAQDRPVPQLSLSGTANVRTLAQWPGLSLTVDRDAYVAVFAVTRGRRELPLQVLSPRNPSDKGMVNAGQRLRVRQLAKDELLHLVNWGEAPVVVAFASTVRPNMSAFDGGKDTWARDLLLDTATANQQELIDVLGKSIFGKDAEYDVVVSTASSPTPLTRYADIWTFDNSCLGETARWSRYAGYAGLGLYSWVDVDPIVRVAMGAGSIFLPWSWSSGLPITLLSGVGQIPSQYSITPVTYGGCTEYRVAWWPQIIYPPMGPTQPPKLPGDTTVVAGPDGLTSPLPRAPRFPTAGNGLQIDPSAVTRADVADVNPTYRSPGAPMDDVSAWRRGETGSARRFPGVTAEERPWSRPGATDSRAYAPNEPPLPASGRSERVVNRAQSGDEPRGSTPMAEERSRQGVPAAPVSPPTSQPVERDVKPSFPSGGSAPPPPPPPAVPPTVPPPSSGSGGPIIPPLAP